MPSFSSPASPSPAHHPTSTPTPARTAPARPTPAPSPTRTTAPKPPLPAVTVGYTAVQRWNRGFEGKLTIVNHGAAAISAWQIAITLPGDRITSVWDAAGHVSGDVLILEPARWDPPVPPHGEMSVGFVAEGPTAAPTSCTFNGASCA
jgi:cellulase/cellobiase CelA1